MVKLVTSSSQVISRKLRLTCRRSRMTTRRTLKCNLLSGKVTVKDKVKTCWWKSVSRSTMTIFKRREVACASWVLKRISSISLVYVHGDVTAVWSSSRRSSLSLYFKGKRSGNRSDLVVRRKLAKSMSQPSTRKRKGWRKDDVHKKSRYLCGPQVD